MNALIAYVIIALGLGFTALIAFRGRRPGKTTSGAFTRDITAQARAGQLSPIIGREREIERLIHVVCRKSKNNPLLIGDAGVGKTKIVEGLALRISEGRVPERLRGKRLLELDLTSMIGGTAMRGEFEQRISGMLARLRQEHSEIILFIDELQMLEQVKGVEGGLNFSDMLKPVLVSGDFSVIGATTLMEYHATLFRDPAIERRFQPMFIGEPTPEATLEIMRGLRRVYESFHHVSISEEALGSAITLSESHIPNRVLPDKAIDLLDEASATVSIERPNGRVEPADILTVVKEWDKMEAAGGRAEA